MRTPPAAIRLIHRSEGHTPYAYNDPVGFCTAGPGILLHRSPCTLKDYERYGSRSHPGIEPAEYDRMFRRALEPRELAVAELVTVPVNACEFGALVSLCWNIGAGNLARSTVIRELNRGHRYRAGLAFMLWVFAGGRKLPGLVIRRGRERRLFRGRHRHIHCGARRLTQEGTL